MIAMLSAQGKIIEINLNQRYVCLKHAESLVLESQVLRYASGRDSHH